MRRKFVVVLSVFLTVLILSAALAGCGKPAKNAEYEEFEQVIKTVLENSVDRMGKDEKQIKASESVKAARQKVFAKGDDAPGLTAFAENEGDGLFDIIAEYSDAVQVMEENYVKGYFELVSQTTMSLPLIAGDALRTYPKVKNFYGVSVGCREEGIFLKAEKEGTSFIVKVYTGGGNFYEEYFVMKLNYNGATDFSFTVYDVAEENAQLNRGAYEMFYYGDSELNFLNFIRGESNTAVYYQNGTDYYLDSADAVEKLYALVKDEFASIDFAAIKELGTAPDFTINGEQWAECYIKYMNGGEHFGAQDGQFDIKNGVLYGWTGKDEDCPSSVTLPSVRSIYYELRFPEHVKELVIPATVQSVKVEKGELERLEGEKLPSQDKTLVECPLKYFALNLNSENGDYRFLDTISVSGGSALFHTQNNCLYSSQDGMLLYVAGAQSRTSLDLNGEVSQGALLCFEWGRFSALRRLSVADGGIHAAGLMLRGTGAPSMLDEMTLKLNGNSTDYEWIFGGAEGGKLGVVNTLNVDFTDMEYMERALQINCSVGTLNISGGGHCNIEVFSEIKRVNADFDGALWLNGIDGGSFVEINLFDLVSGLSFFSSKSATVILPYSLYYFKMNELNSGFEDLATLVFEMGWQEATSLTEISITVNSDGNEFFNKYVFAPMTEEEKSDYKNLTEFKTYFWREQDSPYGEACVDITAYCGGDSVVRVPEKIQGRPVYGFSYMYVEGVKEIHLPSCLKSITFWGTDYLLDKIVWKGTKSQLVAVLGSEEAVYNLLYVRIANVIECIDGNFTLPEEEFSSSVNDTEEKAPSEASSAADNKVLSDGFFAAAKEPFVEKYISERLLTQKL